MLTLHPHSLVTQDLCHNWVLSGVLLSTVTECNCPECGVSVTGTGHGTRWRRDWQDGWVVHRRTSVYFLVVVKCSSAFRIVKWILQFSKCANLRIYCRNAENSRTAHEGKLIPCYWCVKSLDQNTSWVIVGYPRWRFIRTRSLVNCLSFLRNEQVVPDGFESLYERLEPVETHLGRPTRARDKRNVTVPTVWVKPSSCARGFTIFFVVCFLYPAHNRFPLLR